MSVAFITTCIAYVSDRSSKEERTKYMSYHTASTSIASSAGALIGGFCGGYGYKVAFFNSVYTMFSSCRDYLLYSR